MKVILSRKGFDSENGGYPSLILNGSEMITLPIPDEADELSYSDVKTKNGVTLYDIMKSLSEEIKVNGNKCELNSKTHCHLDPDLIESSIKRENGWKGIFGQVGAAETVLEKNNIQEGDLFIFFGWYNDVIERDGKYEFVKGNDRHAMFGYLQIDKILHPKTDEIPEQYRNHPHIINRHIKEDGSNTVYIAKDVCTFDSSIKGYGMFNYNEELDLTKEGMSKSRWQLPEIFTGLKITYHNEESWKDDYFQSNNIGQEFVVEENKQVEEWAQNLIKKYSANRV